MHSLLCCMQYLHFCYRAADPVFIQTLHALVTLHKFILNMEISNSFCSVSELETICCLFACFFVFLLESIAYLSLCKGGMHQETDYIFSSLLTESGILKGQHLSKVNFSLFYVFCHLELILILCKTTKAEGKWSVACVSLNSVNVISGAHIIKATIWNVLIMVIFWY